MTSFTSTCQPCPIRSPCSAAAFFVYDEALSLSHPCRAPTDKTEEEEEEPDSLSILKMEQVVFCPVLLVRGGLPVSLVQL